MRTQKPESQPAQADARRPLVSRIPHSSFFPWKFPRPLLTGVLSLAAASVLQAQEPFAQDISPAFSFSETYIEAIQSATTDGFTEYFVVPNAESKLSATAKLSASGIDFSSFSGETPFAVAIGDFEISGVLSDDPNYSPGATSIRIPVWDEDVETGEMIEVGRAVISWNNKEINVSVNVQRPETYQAATINYVGSDEKIEDTTVCRFSLADRELSDRTVYLKGEANLRTKTVGSGDAAEEYELSTVKLAGAIDSVRPKVQIVGTKDNKIVSSPEFAIKAVASDNYSVVDVQVQLNDGEYTSLYEDEDGKWLLDGIELSYGANVLRVKAIDEDGNESLIAETSVRYWAPLVINISGKGSVTKGFGGSTLREPGAQLSVKATPADGYIFAGWSGSITSATPGINFEMAPDIELTANFIKNPFTAVKGGYSGLLTSDAGALGSVDFQLTGAGSFTAKVGINGRTETLSGSFDSTGHFTGNLNIGDGSPFSVDLQLGLGDDANAISGTISDGFTTFSVNSERSTYNAKNPAPQAGYYTVVLPAGEGTPQGDGYATLNIAANGSATLAGALSDGTPFSYGGSISKDGKLGIYFPAYAGKGFVAGVLEFRENPDVSDLDGTLNWIKAPDATSDGFYADGFMASTNVVGARYKAPKNKQRVISLASTSANAKVVIGEGGLESPIEKTATLNAANRLVVTAPAADKLNVNIVAPKGLFSGNFVDSTGATRKINGVFLQKQNLGAGVFRGANAAGYISITAP